VPRDKDVTAVLTEGLQFDVTGNSGFSVHLDGEAKTAMSSMELVLAGLAGCTGSDVISILRKKRQDVTGLEMRIHGRRAEEHPRRYTHIEITFVVTGRNVDPEAVRRAIELSQTKYCSVSASLRGSANITTRYEIREAESVPA